VAFGTPVARTLSLATAYQASTPAKPALVTINLNSTATLSVSGGTTITGEVRIGPTNAVATGGGTAVGLYKNSLTGTLTATLNFNTDSYNTISFALPAGWFFAVRQTAGTTLSIVSAFDQVAQ